MKTNKLIIWKLFILLFILFIATNNNVHAQQEHYECFIDTSFIDSSEMAFVSSTYGKTFTPKGEIRALIIFAGFTNDNNFDTTGVWPYDDGINPPGKSLPTNTNDYFYTDYNQFNPNNTDKTLSNYLYQMSLPSGQPLKMVADVFPERINVTANIAIDTNTNGWKTYCEWVFDSIAVNYPNFDWGRYDNRKNNPNNSFDNSDVLNNPPDSIIDYVIVLWRYGMDCNKDPNLEDSLSNPYFNKLCNNPYSNTAIANIPSGKTFIDSLGENI